MADKINRNTELHQCSITFTHKEGDEVRIIDIYTPEGIHNRDLAHELIELHGQLCDNKDGQDIYGTAGRCPETLVARLCEKHGWTWEIHKDSENHIDVILD